MASESIRIGIIGAGANTRKIHLPNLKAQPGVEIVEVANRTLESSKSVAAEFGIPTVRETWQEVATSPEVDAVVIGTWPYLHREATCMALESGKHVLCEARMAMNEAEARQMLQAAYAHPECVVQLVPSPFTLQVDTVITEILDQNRLGTLEFFHFESHSAPSTPQGAPLHWRRNRKLSGNNIMMLGIVYESLLRWFGPAEWVSAHARSFNDRACDPETGEEIAVDIPDYLSVQMKMNKGVAGTLLMTELGEQNTPPRITLTGSQGVLQYDFAVDGVLRMGTFPNLDLQPVTIPQEQAGRWRVEEEFIRAIRGEEEVEYTTFTRGVEYMKFTEAVNASFQEKGERVFIQTG